MPEWDQPPISQMTPMERQWSELEGSAPTEPVPFPAIDGGEIGFEFTEGGLDGADESFATLGMAAESDDGITFGVVIGDDQDFAVGKQSVDDPLDQVVGGLAAPGVEDLDLGSGECLGCSGGSSLAVEEEGQGNSG